MSYLVTIGDKGYFQTVLHSVHLAGGLYPNLPIVIYDWGFTAEQRNILRQSPNVRALRRWSFIKNPVPFKLNRHEWMLSQKPYCYKDFVNTYKAPFLFLDGDAYMIREIPELLNGSFSIGVTLRRPEDQVFEKGRCRVINSGVFMLNNLDIVEKWITRMQNTKERLVEQTALTRMIYDDGSISGFKEFSCEEYNYYWVASPIPKTARILHLKGRGVKKRKGLLQ